MKAITDTLGLARSNIAERVKGVRPKRGPQARQGDLELSAEIRRLVDARPTYGYRRIGALLQARAAIRRPAARQRQAGVPADEEARAPAGAPYGRRQAREHDGQVTTLHSNVRWCSDGMEFTCWNGEVVRVAFVLDCHDREVIGWTATTAGLSGEMIRDMMVGCAEARFDGPRAPHRLQWLSDNGSIYAAAKTIEIALTLNLAPCFTPVESPESNGIAEAFVKTFKRDYIRVNPVPNAEAALAAIPQWMADYNDVHPHSGLGYRSPREYIRAMSQPAACPV